MAVVKGSEPEKTKKMPKEMGAVIAVVARLLKAENAHRKKSKMWGLGHRSVMQGHRAELLWLYLRKNPEYIADYERWLNTTDTSGDDTHYFCIRWGLSGNPVDPELVELPRDFKFQRPEPWRVRYNDLFHQRPIQRELSRLKAFKKMGLAVGDLAKDFLIVPPMISEDLLLEMFRSLNKDFLKSRKIAEPIDLQNQRYLNGLVENVALHAMDEAKLKPKPIFEIRSEKFGISGELQTNQIKERVATFKKLSSVTPWIFFSK